jgi:hypothetical protein
MPSQHTKIAQICNDFDLVNSEDFRITKIKSKQKNVVRTKNIMREKGEFGSIMIDFKIVYS